MSADPTASGPKGKLIHPINLRSGIAHASGRMTADSAMQEEVNREADALRRRRGPHLLLLQIKALDQ